MTRSDHTVKNPAIGHQVRFLETSAQTNGELLKIEYIVERPEQKPAIPVHRHSISEEKFETVTGKLGVLLDGDRRILQSGEAVIIAPGQVHTFWNAGEGELRFITEIRPAGALQTYWETVFGLASDEKVGSNGLPNLLQLSVLAPLADSYPPGVPIFATKIIVIILGSLGRHMGYKARYKRYSD